MTKTWCLLPNLPAPGLICGEISAFCIFLGDNIATSETIWSQVEGEEKENRCIVGFEG